MIAQNKRTKQGVLTSPNRALLSATHIQEAQLSHDYRRPLLLPMILRDNPSSTYIPSRCSCSSPTPPPAAPAVSSPTPPPAAPAVSSPTPPPAAPAVSWYPVLHPLPLLLLYPVLHPLPLLLLYPVLHPLRPPAAPAVSSPTPLPLLLL